MEKIYRGMENGAEAIDRNFDIVSAMPTQDDYNILETSIAMNKISYMYDGNFIIDFDTNYLTWDSSAVINYGENLYSNIPYGSVWLSGFILLAFDTHTNEILALSGYHEMTEGRTMLAFIITSDISKSMNFAIGKLSAIKNGIEMTFEDLKSLEETIPYNRIKGSIPIKNKKYMCFGDSITSDQVCGVGTLIANDLQLDLQANFAVGWSTMQDWQDAGANVTVETLTPQQNEMVNTNVLSNQVLRAIQSTATNGQQLTWTHQIDGIFSIDTGVGVGTGTLVAPDVIYISSSTNDGENINTPIVDDTDTVLTQSYSQLDKISIASALRWAIETFQSAYPNAQIFVASPIQTNCGNSWMSFENNKIKRDIIAKVCQFTSVNFIDSFNASGFSKLKATSGVLTDDGIHPNTTGKTRLVSYVGGEMKHKFLDI